MGIKSQYFHNKVSKYSKHVTSRFTSCAKLIDKHGPVMTTLSTIAIAVLTAVYVHWSHKQWEVMNGQLQQMQGSGEQTNRLLCLTQQQVAIAKKANEETHNILTATQGAFFQLTIEYEQNRNTPISGGTGTPSIDVFVTNIGKSAARTFSGESRYIRGNKRTGKVIQSVEKYFADNSVKGGGADSMQFPVIPSTSNYMDYASDSFAVTTKLQYDDGFNKGRTQIFCREMAVTQHRGEPIWVECGEAKTWEQLVK